MNRAFVDAAHRLVVVADHTKWGQVGLSTIVPLEAADIVISDTALPEEARARLGERVDDLRLVHTGDEL